MRIGIDLGGTKIEGILLSDQGEICERKRVATPHSDYNGIVKEITQLVLHLEEQNGATCPVGIGTPGAISPATGCMKNSNTTCLNGKPLQQDLEASLQRPLRLANDANCFCLSEAVDGAGQGYDVVFGVIAGTGLGGGVVVHQQIIGGANGIGGEWGHNQLPWQDERDQPNAACYCGKVGCNETYLSGTGLSRQYELAAKKKVSAKEVVNAAEAGDALAIRVLDAYHHQFAKALASVINILDPDVIVMGGGMSNLPSLYDKVPQLLDGYVFSDKTNINIVPPRYGDSSGVRGAAWLWPVDSANTL